MNRIAKKIDICSNLPQYSTRENKSQLAMYFLTCQLMGRYLKNFGKYFCLYEAMPSNIVFTFFVEKVSTVDSGRELLYTCFEHLFIF